MKKAQLYVSHMLECISKIEEYTLQGKEFFFAESIVRDATYRNLEIIGEAAKRLTPSMKSNYVDIPWRQVVGLRNTLIHVYDGIEPSEIWGIVEKHLPKLKIALLDMQKKLEDPNE